MLLARFVRMDFAVAKDADGSFRLTVRETRYNSQKYPIVTSVLQAETFRTAALAKAHARDHFGAETGQFATS